MTTVVASSAHWSHPGNRRAFLFRSCRLGSAVIGLILLAEPLWAARPQLSFPKPVDLPELGIRVRLMPEASGVPLPPPVVRTVELHQGGRTWKEDRYSCVELWRHSQCAGRWVGRHTNTLVLAVVTRSLPEGFAHEYVTRAEYEAKAGAVTNAPSMGKDDLTRWVADFTGYPAPVPRNVPRMPLRISPVVCYSLGRETPSRLAYVFRLNRPKSETWMCALFDLNPAIDPVLAAQAIEAEFLGTVVFTTPSQETAAGSSSPTGNTRPAGPGKAPVAEEPPSADMAATRKQVIDSIRNLKGWWYETTDHYIILSNLKGSMKAFVDDLRDDLGALRGAFVESVPFMGANGVAAVIRVPATPEEYLGYVGVEMSWSGGLWIPSRKELVIRPMDAGGSREKRKSVLRVAYHEAFHQYVFYALDQSEPSMWFNEGYAKFFENAEIENGRVRIDEDPQALALLSRALDSDQVALARLFQASRQDFYGGGEEGRSLNYALAWAMVYYLRKGAPLEPGAPYAGLLEKYVAAMRTTPDGAAATSAMLAGVSVAELQQSFVRFWRSVSKRGGARRYDPFARKGKS